MQRNSKVPAHAGEFRLNLARAIEDQFVEALESLVPALLDDGNVEATRKEAGVYQLLLKGTIVYVGKADSDLRGRLRMHLRKLSARIGARISDITFRALTMADVFQASHAEWFLLKKHLIGTASPAWNRHNFGNNDPGRNRDKTAVEAGSFDAEFPIQITDEPVSVPKLRDGIDARQFFVLLHRSLPYTLRADKLPKAKPVLALLPLSVPDMSPRPLGEWLHLALSQLPPNWQATALPGRIVVYQESEALAYPAAFRYWRSTVNGVEEKYL